MNLLGILGNNHISFHPFNLENDLLKKSLLIAASSVELAID